MVVVGQLPYAPTGRVRSVRNTASGRGSRADWAAGWAGEWSASLERFLGRPSEPRPKERAAPSTRKKPGPPQCAPSPVVGRLDHRLRDKSPTLRFTGSALRRKGTLAVAGRYQASNTRFQQDVAIDGRVLGTGMNGDVVLATNRTTGASCAVKSFSKLRLSREKRVTQDGRVTSMKEDLRAEVEVYLSLDHPHVARLEQVYETDNDLHLVMEYLQGGELFDKVEQLGRFGEDQAAETVRQLCSAVAYMHAMRITHRDLKPENFVYDRPGSRHLKLIDFGFSKHLEAGEDTLSRTCGTLRYMAPEIFAHAYTEKADVWSLGIIAFTLLCGAPPWLGSDEEAIVSIRAGRPYYWPRRWDPLSSDTKEFVKALLVQDPSRRPSAAGALGLPWIRNRCAASPLPDQALIANFRRYVRRPAMQRVCLFVGACGMRHSLPQAKVDFVREQFRALDLTYSGAPTFEDFRTALAKVGVDWDEAAALFHGMDLNGDDALAYTEFIAAASNNFPEEETLRITFNRFDTEGQGFITAGDVRAVLGEAIEGTGGAEEFVEEADSSGDGAVSFADFFAYANKAHKAAQLPPVAPLANGNESTVASSHASSDDVRHGHASNRSRSSSTAEVWMSWSDGSPELMQRVREVEPMALPPSAVQEEEEDERGAADRDASEVESPPQSPKRWGFAGLARAASS